MRHVMYAIVAIAIIAMAVVPRLAQSQETSVCRPSGGDCILTTAAIYNQCVDLALRRGLTLTKGDRGPFDSFMYSCIRGRVTR